jgi:hypothetical protein
VLVYVLLPLEMGLGRVPEVASNWTLTHINALVYTHHDSENPYSNNIYSHCIGSFSHYCNDLTHHFEYITPK